MTTTDDRAGHPSAAGGSVSVALVAWDDPEFAALRTAQQAELRELYGDDDLGHAMTGDDVTATVLLRVGGEPVACGALRDVAVAYGRGVGEVKRMFVLPGHRGRGNSRTVLTELERLARERGWRRLILETGVLQPEAIGLYVRAGYVATENFGEYVGVVESRCFAKDLRAQPRERSAREAGSDAGVVTLARVAWDDAEARELRRSMWTDTTVRYPEVVDLVEAEGGPDVDDERQGDGVLTTVVARLDGRPVGCASLRAARDGYPAGSGELKKVFVDDSARGSGVARALLIAIEDDARARGLTSVVLQTGIRQPEAVGLYAAVGYRPVAPFGPYVGDQLTLCFAKPL
ncbi:GNAT family N-acetyltransferase [Cellulomonas sp. P22]|uniref:GNAT family N-acetyltransferase n=1 Tax=Cellulomonas sp. P22 TaxID=3373189 RepID=UPI00379A98B3